MPESPRYVLYWMQAFRRVDENLALDWAIREANALGLPVVVYEGLRADYPGASARLHRFILDGVAENARAAWRRGLKYVLVVESHPKQAKDLLPRLAADAALVVTDDFPAYIFPGQTRALARRTTTPVVAVDACGVVPIRAFPRAEVGARTFRPRLHDLLPAYLVPPPSESPRVRAGSIALDLGDVPAADPFAPPALLTRAAGVDESVPPVAGLPGGRQAALARLDRFLRHGLHGYATDRRRREPRATSELSPYLHFGRLSPHEVIRATLDAGAAADDIDAFLEQLVVRRELSFNLCAYEPRHAGYDAVPAWAQKSLAAHRADPRPRFTEEQLERAATGDEIWDLAQRELCATGRIQGYVRMLWGKRVIEWLPSPEAAHAFLVRMHDRYAIDGRDPNTYANILWLFGWADRPFAERPVFGMVRPMTSAQTAKKVDIEAYRRYVDSVSPR